MDTIYKTLEIWKLPLSKYAIIWLKNGFRVIEVYIQDDVIRTRGDIPHKDYNSYLEALNHLEINNKIELEMLENDK